MHPSCSVTLLQSLNQYRREYLEKQAKFEVEHTVQKELKKRPLSKREASFHGRGLESRDFKLHAGLNNVWIITNHTQVGTIDIDPVHTGLVIFFGDHA